MSTRARLLLASVISSILASTGISAGSLPAASAAPVPTPHELLAAVPVLPKMTVGYSKALFRTEGRRGVRQCSAHRTALAALSSRASLGTPACTPGPGPWVVDLGSRRVSTAGAIVFAPVIPVRAAWASGAYGWSTAQRAALLEDRGAPEVGAGLIPVTRALAVRIASTCRDSAESTCLITAVPDRLKPAAAAAVVAAATRHRLSMTRPE